MEFTFLLAYQERCIDGVLTSILVLNGDWNLNCVAGTSSLWRSCSHPARLLVNLYLPAVNLIRNGEAGFTQVSFGNLSSLNWGGLDTFAGLSHLLLVLRLINLATLPLHDNGRESVVDTAVLVGDLHRNIR